MIGPMASRISSSTSTTPCAALTVARFGGAHGKILWEKWQQRSRISIGICWMKNGAKLRFDSFPSKILPFHYRYIFIWSKTMTLDVLCWKLSIVWAWQTWGGATSQNLLCLASVFCWQDLSSDREFSLLVFYIRELNTWDLLQLSRTNSSDLWD